MSLESPLKWTRTEHDDVDSFDRKGKSYASCTSSNAGIYAALLVAINGIVLVIGNCYSFLSRRVELEFGESWYIGLCLGLTLQAWALAIPILIVTWDDPQARFFVLSGLISVTSLAVQLFVVIPKWMAIREFVENKKRTLFRKFLRTVRSTSSEIEDDEDESSIAREDTRNDQQAFSSTVENPNARTSIFHSANDAIESYGFEEVATGNRTQSNHGTTSLRLQVSVVDC
jgi:hypothetical protein